MDQDCFIKICACSTESRPFHSMPEKEMNTITGHDSSSYDSAEFDEEDKDTTEMVNVAADLDVSRENQMKVQLMAKEKGMK